MSANISWELSDISVARYGLDLRLPMYRALRKLSQTYSIDLGASWVNTIRKPDGEDVRRNFMNCYLTLRDGLRSSIGDSGAITFYTSGYGYNIKTGLHDALKGLEAPDSTARYTLSHPAASVYVIAGNDEPMFKVRGLITLQDGINFYGKAGGVGVLNPDTNKYEYTMRVSNVFTGTFIDYQTISRDEKLGADDHITFYTRDEVTVAVDPGLIKIEVLDYDGNVYSEGHIKSEVYKFGMTPAEGYMPTDDPDYRYISDSSSSTTLSYTGNDIMIKTPTVLGGQPLKTIGNTTFGYSDLIKVKIQEGVETIE